MAPQDQSGRGNMGLRTPLPASPLTGAQRHYVNLQRHATTNRLVQMAATITTPLNQPVPTRDNRQAEAAFRLGMSPILPPQRPSAASAGRGDSPARGGRDPQPAPLATGAVRQQRVSTPSGRGAVMPAREARPPTMSEGRAPPRQSLAREMAVANRQARGGGHGRGGNRGASAAAQAGRGRGGGGAPAQPSPEGQAPSPSAIQRASRGRGGGLRGSVGRVDTAADGGGSEDQQRGVVADPPTAAVTTADARQRAAFNAATLARAAGLASSLVASGGSGSSSTVSAAAQPHRSEPSGGSSSYEDSQGQGQAREAAPSPETAANDSAVVSAPPLVLPPLPLPVAIHSSWIPITIGTAKCDHCAHDRRLAVLQRCAECGTQCCQACWRAKRDDPDTRRAGSGRFYFTLNHVMDNNINWTRPARRTGGSAAAAARRARKMAVRASNSET